MTTILPDTRPMLYCVTGAGDPITGTTLVGELTGVNPTLTVVADADEMAYVAALPASEFPPLPDAGWLDAGDIYQYEGAAVIVRQSHKRTIYAPADTPALFIVGRKDAASMLEWVAGEQVQVGTRRTYDGVEYKCNIAHVTEYPPPQAQALWAEVVEEGDPWQSGIIYDLGAVVTHAGATWESRRANNVWEPGANDSGWLRTEPYPSEWYYLGGEGYPLGWEVYYNGHLWRNTLEGNHWTPGVYGWEQIGPIP